jgi:hypothetical protein
MEKHGAGASMRLRGPVNMLEGNMLEGNMLEGNTLEGNTRAAREVAKGTGEKVRE